VTNIGPHGLWVFVRGKEHFLPYKEYPWFKNATVSQIANLELHHNVDLYWPSLDVDLSLDCLENPDKYPLVADCAGR
jgi:hypothetical protein